MMTKAIENRRDSVIKSINDSKLPSDAKEQFVEMVSNAADATNGFSPDQKIQAISEQVFSLTVLNVLNRIDVNHGKWSALVACRWALTTIVGIVATMLVFRPELSGLIMKIVGQ